MVFTDEGKEILYTFVVDTEQGVNHYIAWADVNWRGEDAIGSKVVAKSYFEEVSKKLEYYEHKLKLLSEKLEAKRQKELAILRNS